MKKLKWLWQWFDDRTGTSELVGPLATHPVSPDSKWAYVFGSATLFTFILQVVTGVALAFLYQPSSETAYPSLLYISNQVPLAGILRGIHSFGASAMVLLVGMHMARVYLTASYKYPREVSWLSGSILLILTLGMAFTGQLLRFDANGVWTAVVGAEQAGRLPFIGTWAAHFLLGGDTVGGATVNRFFALHVFVVPGLLIGLLGLHLYLVIRNGVSESPKSGHPVVPSHYRQWYHSMLKEKGVPFFPNAAWRDMAFGLFAISVILALAVIFGAPKLGDPPNPASINDVPRPDWYFLWVYALFALMPRDLESYAIAFGPIIIGIVLILLPFLFNKGERSPLRRPWAIGIVIFIVTMVGALTYEGVKSPWSPDFGAKPLSAKVIGDVGPEAQKGAHLFYSKGCIFCHQISSDGGTRGPDLTTIGDDLNAYELNIKIVNGGGNMPAFGPSVTGEELKALVAFLETRKLP
jgi:ubiquinol-cytochrome c reductase cytochrome b subunit